MRFFGLVFLLAACGADDDGGEDPPDAPMAGIDAPVAGPDAPAGARSISFDLSQDTITISGGTQVEAFQLTNISTTGISLTGGYHYHVYLDDSSGAYLIYSDDVPTSPDVFVKEETTAGEHLVIASIEDDAHDPIGVESSRTLTVNVE